MTLFKFQTLSRYWYNGRLNVQVSSKTSHLSITVTKTGTTSSNESRSGILTATYWKLMFFYTCEYFSVFYYMIHLLNKTQEIKIDEVAYLPIEFFLIHNLNNEGFHIIAHKIKHALYWFLTEKWWRAILYSGRYNNFRKFIQQAKQSISMKKRKRKYFPSVNYSPTDTSDETKIQRLHCSWNESSTSTTGLLPKLVPKPDHLPESVVKVNHLPHQF